MGNVHPAWSSGIGFDRKIDDAQDRRAWMRLLYAVYYINFVVLPTSIGP